jgi:thiol-disulfide isomerase/thioredoxin
MKNFPTSLARARSAAVLAALLGLAFVAAPAGALEPGQALPVLGVPGDGGATVPLLDGKAHATYIDFWASWCGPCRQSFPWMNRMHDKFGPQGLRIVAINLDAKRPDAQGFLAKIPANFELAFDAGGEAAKQFGVKAMPSSVLVGADGKVIAVHQGFREEDEADLERAIAAALERH